MMEAGNVKIESADGREGYLIWCGGDRYVFRIYNEVHDFVDYDISHSDMRIRIIDTDAYFYTDGTDARIDHSPETLGINRGDV
jgi:hypothetical protein